MNYLIVVFAVSMSVCLVSGQFFGSQHFNNFDGAGSFGLHSLTSDFNSPSAFSAGSVRDPRQNRGPVVFPPPPPNAVEESSGVIVGASGYGFVPPNGGQPTQYRNIITTYNPEPPLVLTPAAALNRFNNGYFQRLSFY